MPACHACQTVERLGFAFPGVYLRLRTQQHHSYSSCVRGPWTWRTQSLPWKLRAPFRACQQDRAAAFRFWKRGDLAHSALPPVLRCVAPPPIIIRSAWGPLPLVFFLFSLRLSDSNRSHLGWASRSGEKKLYRIQIQIDPLFRPPLTCSRVQPATDENPREDFTKRNLRAPAASSLYPRVLAGFYSAPR